MLIALVTLVEVFHQLAPIRGLNSDEFFVLKWFIDWIWIGAVAVTGWLIARGHGWARWLLVAIAAYEVFNLGAIGDSLDSSRIVYFPVGPLFSVAAVILVFGPGRGWFNRDISPGIPASRPAR